MGLLQTAEIKLLFGKAKSIRTEVYATNSFMLIPINHWVQNSHKRETKKVHVHVNG